MSLFVLRKSGGRCPCCGTEHTACGPPSDATPVDQNIKEVAAVSGPLKRYKVTSPNGVETVMKLNEADAGARGLTDADLAPETGGEHGPQSLSLPDDDRAAAASPDGGEQEPGDSEDQAPGPEKKARPAAPNKARTSSANKSRSRSPRGGAQSGGG